MIIVDTSVWVEFFNARNSPVVALFEDYIKSRRALCINGLIEMEILQGIRDQKSYHKTKMHLRPFLRFPDCKYIYLQKAEEIYRKCRAKGITIRKSIDCIIAANAMIEGLAIMHVDRDYLMIKKVFSDLQICG